jgi:superfamily II DNA or RNA helicase
VVDLAEARVTVTPTAEPNRRLALRCSACQSPENNCEHIVATLSLILEEKTVIGLSQPPKERVVVENLSEEELVKGALAERKERAGNERMRLTRPKSGAVWGDYNVFNPASGKSYRVSLRGWERGESFCECPDFRKNTLGTCKHIMCVLDSVTKAGNAPGETQPWQPTEVEVYLNYSAATPELRLNLPAILPQATRRLLAPYSGKVIDDVPAFVKTLRQLDDAGLDALVFPDALEHIQSLLFQNHMHKLTAEIRNNPELHPLRTTLLKAELLPYQLDGIAFAAGAGRAVLADDMGLGKTIQGVGVAELLAREAGIHRVLVICPASLKSQWLEEISRFSNRSARLVMGSARERPDIYSGSQFFTICNYEQTLRDHRYIGDNAWDLIILDEAQRLKNWEAATSRVVKSLKSRFALALTGTPLENRLEELYTVVSFIDEHRLGPAFRFLNQHRLSDAKGHILGYRKIGELRERLKPILLRRTRAMVMRELPDRHTEIIRVKPTQPQLEIHQAHIRIVRQVVSKTYISEMDILRLRRALLMCRLAANGTYLVDHKVPGHSSKLEELDSLLGRLLAEDGRKIIVFSEWTTMLDLIEPMLVKYQADFVRLDGSVPQTKRQAIVNRFQKQPDCQVFLATNAGSTGLNLQAANTVVNIDLPWNPAVLEQRIGRAHRMGQKRPVQVYILVTEETLEERLLGILGAKQDLTLAALDPDSKVDVVTMSTGMDEIKARLEVFLGMKASTPPEAKRFVSDSEEEKRIRRRQMEEAGGRLFLAAIDFLGEMLPASLNDSLPKGAAWGSLLGEYLRTCVEDDPSGKPRISVVLPDTEVLERLITRLSGAGPSQEDSRLGPESAGNTEG